MATAPWGHPDVTGGLGQRHPATSTAIRSAAAAWAARVTHEAAVESKCVHVVQPSVCPAYT